MPQVAVIDGKLAQISTQLDIVRVPGFQGIAAGATATLQVPRKWCLHRGWLRFLKADGTTLLTDAELAAAITKVRVIVGGNRGTSRIIDNSQADLAMLYDHHYGRIKPLTADKGNIPLLFDRNYLSDADGEEAAGLGTSDLSSLNIEFDQAGGGLAAFCEAWFEAGPNEPIGRFVRLYNLGQNAVASGDLDLFGGNGLPVSGQATLLGLHYNKTTITKWTVKPDGQNPIIDNVPIEVWNAMLEHYSYKPQSANGFSNLTFDRRWRLADGINLGDPGIRITPTFSANPGAVRIIAEVVENG